MKKLFLIFPIVCCGCAEVQNLSAPSETILNDKCADVQRFEIFYVYDKGGALAKTCNVGENRCRFGMTVFVPERKGEYYWDYKVIEAPIGKCIAYDGVYRYSTVEGSSATVPKLKIVDFEIPNPAYVQYKKERAKQEKSNKQ
jgi:hypothetical protein